MNHTSGCGEGCGDYTDIVVTATHGETVQLSVTVEADYFFVLLFGIMMACLMMRMNYTKYFG